jgi:sugar phosphate isomerase/epimerase
VRLTRRDVLRIAAGVAAAPLLPKAAGAALATPKAAAGRFLSAPQLALLDAVSETILPADEHSPGAHAAQVAAYIDGRLAEYDPSIEDLRKTRELFTEGLAEVDALARQSVGKGFLEASVAEREEVLGALAAARPAKSTAERFFVDVKDWTAQGYYTSKIGLHDELEYKGNTMLQEFVGTDVATLPAPWAASTLGGVRFGAQSYTFRKFDIDRMIAALRSVGLASVELWNGHLDPTQTSDDEFRSVRRRFEAAGIEVGAYCANFPTNATDAHLERAFEGALLLGTNVMTSSFEKPLLDRVDALCVKHQVRLGIHNHYFGDPWFKGDRSLNFESPDDFLGALQGRSRFLSINLDIGHFAAAGHDPLAFFKANYPRIVSLHVKDRDKDQARTDRPFGRGAVPILEVLKEAQRVGFLYAANLEWEMDEADPTEGVRGAFEYVKQGLSA